MSENTSYLKSPRDGADAPPYRARTAQPDSATNQFYINVKDNNSLNHRNKSRPGWGYAVFGKVVDGMSVVNAIKEVKTGACLPLFKRDCPETPIMIL